MEIEIQKRLSVSLKKEFEEGRNPEVKIRFNEKDYSEETSSKVLAVLEEVDHRHLSEDPRLRMKTYEDLIRWLDKRLAENFLKPLEIQINIDDERCLKSRF